MARGNGQIGKRQLASSPLHQFTSKAKRASIIIVLHSHLPLIREPEIKDSIEETWFFEAVIESYIPLMAVFERLIEKGISFKIVLSLSPTLLEMLDDDYLMKRLNKHIERLSELLHSELKRTKNTPYERIVRFYRERLRKIKDFLSSRTVTGVIRKLAREGYLELATTAATHAYLPLFAHYPQVVWLQIKEGVTLFKSKLKDAPEGFWLPECGYFDGLFYYLKKAHIKWTVLEGHSIALGNPSPPEGIFRPVFSPEGIIVLARDADTCKFVWSRDSGYPGNPWYRDFYRDVCYELNDSGWKIFRPDGIRHHTGLKYFRVTGREEKKPYIREKAMSVLRQHAQDFVKRLSQRAIEAENIVKEPVIVLAFDTELFGHWWFEGPEWLEAVIELIGRHPEMGLAFIDDIKNGKDLRVVKPLPSSWGEGGFSDTWVCPESSGYLRAIYRAIEIAISHKGLLNDRKLLRELLLMQSSDFLFMLKRDNMAKTYGSLRLKAHLKRFYHLISKRPLQPALSCPVK
ncbi:MAG: 1,4-alpha-glucan branching protein domain-containing protein [Thermodesulfovibrionales bacterium]